GGPVVRPLSSRPRIGCGGLDSRCRRRSIHLRVVRAPSRTQKIRGSSRLGPRSVRCRIVSEREIDDVHDSERLYPLLEISRHGVDLRRRDERLRLDGAGGWRPWDVGRRRCSGDAVDSRSADTARDDRRQADENGLEKSFVLRHYSQYARLHGSAGQLQRFCATLSFTTFGDSHSYQKEPMTKYKFAKVPPRGEGITYRNGVLSVPDNPIIPFVEGDGTGPDIWRASVRVFDAAVERAYQGQRKVHWMEVFAGEKSFKQYQDWLPQETVDAMQEFRVSIKGPLTTPVGGGIRSLNVTLRQVL